VKYQVIVPKPVQKQLNKIPDSERDRILSAIRMLADVPRPLGVKKLKVSKDTYRIRISVYRVIYEVRDQELIILLLSTGHRQDVYRSL
jgi:mRNA interferase RelE/StbE